MLLAGVGDRPAGIEVIGGNELKAGSTVGTAVEADMTVAVERVHALLMRHVIHPHAVSTVDDPFRSDDQIPIHADYRVWLAIHLAGEFFRVVARHWIHGRSGPVAVEEEVFRKRRIDDRSSKRLIEILADPLIDGCIRRQAEAVARLDENRDRKRYENQ